jgi:glycerol transport system ATP-binding protein
LQLVDVSYRPGAETWLHSLNLSLVPGTMNLLLGATLAGKTTLMRLMAGLDRPTSGRLLIGERDVTGVPVRQRNLAMVYQQFINYPSLTVHENIASPLRLARKSATEIRDRVATLAETLRLTPFLDRYPAELSGGQQQRTALARALAKDAELVLLDEPLVNLDYKLREELREELTQLFAQRQTTVVYATTEPHEALQLGGQTAVLIAGRLVQHGPTIELFRRPASIEVARAFSDPPLNEFAAAVDGHVASLPGGVRIPLPWHAGQVPSEVVLAARAYQFKLAPTSSVSGAFSGRIDLAEISGSETYLHVSNAGWSIVAQLPGVHAFELGDPCTVHIDSEDLYCFDPSGALLFAPQRA